MVGDDFIFVERDFPTSEKKIVQILTLFLAFRVFKKLIMLLRFVFIAIISLKASMFFFIS